MRSKVLEQFLAELRRSWILFRRYPVQAISGMAMTLMLFLGLVFGAGYMAGSVSKFGDRLDSLIVGYVLWNLLIFAMGEISVGLRAEAELGTLEQLLLSPLSGVRIFLMRALANQAVNLILNLAILGIILVVTGKRLHFTPAILVPLATALMATYGLGLALGSLALVFKRIGAALNLSQFGLMALVMVPYEQIQPASWLDALPVVPSAAMLRQVMVQGSTFTALEFTTALANGLGYLLMGVVIFKWMDGIAREHGFLSGY